MMKNAIVHRSDSGTQVACSDFGDIDSLRYVGRSLPVLIVTCFIVFILLASYIKVNIVSSAPGIVVPSGLSKKVQSSVSGIVETMFVKDGSAVKAGDLLLVMKTSEIDAHLRKLREKYYSSWLDMEKASALLNAVEEGEAPRLARDKDMYETSDRFYQAQRWADAEYHQFVSEIREIDIAIREKSAALDAATNLLKSFQDTAPIMTELLASYEKLLAKGAVSRHAYLEQKQKFIVQQMEHANQHARIEEISSQLAGLHAKRESLHARSLKEFLDVYNTAKQARAQISQDIAAAEAELAKHRIVSPVNGVVQEVSVFTRGAVVTSAQQLLVVVPDDQPLEVQAKIPNKEVGFVREGQDVSLKVDAYNFAKYGSLKGKIISISDDAVLDEEYGMVFNVRISLSDHQHSAQKPAFAPFPGLQVTADINTGQRTILEYFLIPARGYIAESFDER